MFATIFDLVCWAAAFLVVWYVSSLLHELGHALCGRLAGLPVTSCGLGTSGPFWTGQLGGVNVYLATDNALQGSSTLLVPRVFPDRRRFTLALAGGILAHLALVILALTLCSLWPGWKRLWLLVAGVNLLQALPNLLPFSLKLGATALPSDGAMIRRLWRTGVLDAGPAAALEAMRTYDQLWLETGDTRAGRWHRAMAAAAWVELGDSEKAVRLVHESLNIPPDPEPAINAHTLAVQGLAHAACGEYEHAADALGRADAAFETNNVPEGRYLVSLWSAVNARLRGDVETAIGMLDSLAENPLTAERPRLRAVLLKERLLAHTLCAEGGYSADLRVEYEALPTELRTDADDVTVWSALARLYAGAEAGEAACDAYRRVLEAVRRVDQSFTDADDRARYRRCQAGLIAEAHACLERFGQPEMATAEAFFPAPETIQREAAEARRLADAGYLRKGVRLMLLNAACMGAAAILLAGLRWAAALTGMGLLAWVQLAVVVLFAVLLVYLAVGGLTLLAHHVGRRYYPGQEFAVGQLVMALAVVPWPSWVLALLWIGTTRG